MQIKIISNGTDRTTKIINVETGEELENIYKVSWCVGVGKFACAKLSLIDVPVEIIGEVKNGTV